MRTTFLFSWFLGIALFFVAMAPQFNTTEDWPGDLTEFAHAQAPGGNNVKHNENNGANQPWQPATKGTGKKSCHDLGTTPTTNAGNRGREHNPDR